MAHGRCDQQDNSPVVGPTGPTAVLGAHDLRYVTIGPGHFGGLISSPYPDGRRVIWSNGRQQIVKLDYETLDVIASRPTGLEPITPGDELIAEADALDTLAGADALERAVGLALRFLTGL